MERKLIRDEIIPAKYAKAFEIKKGQVLRIYLTEDKQVGDCVFYNARDYKEWFHVGMTMTVNVNKGTGNAYSYKHFYSKPPKVSLMLTVLEDTVKNHSGNIASRCNRGMMQRIGHNADDRTCDQSLTEVLAPYGISPDEVPADVFNVFMNSELHEDGTFTRKPPTALKGDYIDLLAEMDLLAAISACPAESGPVNDYGAKSLGYKILE